ncbi:MAG: hypothetical protein KDK70_36015, partial [Myxococcales bacterium]|nr:hypothetical protein [Myxococcales bacterium]
YGVRPEEQGYPPGVHLRKECRIHEDGQRTLVLRVAPTLVPFLEEGDEAEIAARFEILSQFSSPPVARCFGLDETRVERAGSALLDITFADPSAERSGASAPAR